MCSDEYEIESVILRRINHSSQAAEYLVRFKGYGPGDDTWLPSSAFNTEINFETISNRGRKRKHTIQKHESVDPFTLHFLPPSSTDSKSNWQTKRPMLQRGMTRKVKLKGSNSSHTSSENHIEHLVLAKRAKKMHIF